MTRLLPPLLLFPGCVAWQAPWPDDTGHAGDDVLVVTPQTLTFRTSASEDVAETASFIVANHSDHDVTLWEFTHVRGEDGPDSDAAAAAVFTVDAAAGDIVKLGPGDQLEVPVSFRPLVDGTILAHLDVRHSDGDEPLRVDLVGYGTAPSLAVGGYTVPVVPIHCEVEFAVPILNVGSEDAAIEPIDDTPIGSFTPIVVPTYVPAGGSAELRLRYAPTADAAIDRATLTLETNDPAAPVLDVVVEGRPTVPDVTEETFWYGTGDGASVLLALEDVGAGSWSPRLTKELQGFLTGLANRGVAYRVTAVSTASACPAPDGWFATPALPAVDAAADLEALLIDGDVGAWGDDLTGLAVEAVGHSGPGDCLDGWLHDDDPLFVLLAADADTADADGDVAALAAAHADSRVWAFLPDDCAPETPEYAAAVTATGGERFDLCDDDWSAELDTFAAAIATAEGGPTTFPLAGVPFADTLVVSVLGWENDTFAWHLDGGATIVFDDPPPIGSTITVEYVDEAVCDG